MADIVPAGTTVHVSRVPRDKPPGWTPPLTVDDHEVVAGDRVRLDLRDGTEPRVLTVDQIIPNRDGSYTLQFEAPDEDDR